MAGEDEMDEYFGSLPAFHEQWRAAFKLPRNTYSTSSCIHGVLALVQLQYLS